MRSLWRSVAWQQAGSPGDARAGGGPVPAAGPVAGLVELVFVQARGGGPVVASRPGAAPRAAARRSAGVRSGGVLSHQASQSWQASSRRNSRVTVAGLAADDPADWRWGDAEGAGDAGAVVAHRDQGPQPPHGAVRVACGPAAVSVVRLASGGRGASDAGGHGLPRRPDAQQGRPAVRRAELMVAAISRSVSPVDAGGGGQLGQDGRRRRLRRRGRRPRTGRRCGCLPCSCPTQAARWLRSPALRPWPAGRPAWRWGSSRPVTVAQSRPPGCGPVADEPVGPAVDLGGRGEDVAAAGRGSPGGGGAACRSAGRCR